MSETVLIVDDQAEVADGIAAALMRAGRQVIVCYDAESAHYLIEEAQLFIEAAHSCFARMAAQPAAVPA